MGRLDSRAVLVAGGAGNVGEGIVRALLHDGAQVVVPARGEEKLARLRALLEEPPRLLTMAGDVADPEGVLLVRDAVAARLPRLDAVVVSVGGWWQGERLIDVPLETWERVLASNLTSHLVIARAFLPLLLAARHGSYVMIGGSAGLQPVSGASLACIASAGQIMLARMLMEESKGSGVRVNELMIGTPVVTRGNPKGKPEWLTADDVGRYVAWLVSDEASMVSGQVLPLAERPTAAS